MFALTEMVWVIRHTSMVAETSAVIPQGMSLVNLDGFSILELANSELQRYACARTFPLGGPGSKLEGRMDEGSHE
jgi:hypothetical protein